MTFYQRWVFCFFLTLGFSSLFANPQEMKIVSGKANITTPKENILEVLSKSDKTILEWKDFSIASDEITYLTLPNSSSSVLNRVTGKKLSAIDGRLESNGNVFLINQNGILIGKEGLVKTAAFYASTLDVTNSAFKKYTTELLFSGDSDQEIINLGTIEATEGNVALFAKKVDHEGSIKAEKGSVALGVGREILLKPLEKEKIYIKPAADEEKEDFGLTNSGTIQSMHSELKADGNLYVLAIKDAGHVDALGSVEENGQIYLFAEDGTVCTTSTLQAEGGEVKIVGKRIAIGEKAHIDVSSDNGGGKVFVGGGKNGNNPSIPNSEFLFIAPRSVIEANAKEEGDGGEVILWGDDTVFFKGDIQAEGKGSEHRGGFVEISTKGNLSIPGTVRTLCEGGQTGELLIDPTDVTISSAATSKGSFDGGSPDTFSYDAGVAGTSTNLKVSELVTQLGGSNVRVTTSSTQADTGNLTVDSTVGSTGNVLAWAATTLYLDADNDVVINGLIEPTSGNISVFANNDILIEPQGNTESGIKTTGTGNVTLTADGGDIQLVAGTNADAKIDMSGGVLTIQANNAFTMVGGIDSNGINGECFITQTGAGDLNLTAKTISLNAGRTTGSSGGKKAFAKITHSGTGDMVFSVNGSLFEIIGGTDINSVDDVTAFVEHLGNGDITINAPNAILSIAGGDASGTNGTSNAFIDGNNVIIASNAIFIAGGTGPTSLASIDVTGNLSCTIGGDIDIVGGSGAISDASIDVTSGSFTGTLTGDLNVQGGSGAGSESRVTTTNGDIIISGRDISLLGKSGSATSKAFVSSTSGNITMTQTGNIELTGGTSSNAQAYITTTSGNIALSGKNLTMSGNAGNSSAYIRAPGGTLQSTLTGDYSISAGPFAASKYILSSNGNMSLTGANFTLQGGTTVRSPAEVYVGAGNLTANISGTTRIYGGSSSTDDSYANFNINSGNINFTGGNLILKGGSGLNSPAQMLTPVGSFTANLSGDLDVVGGSGTGTNQAEIQTDGGPISITANDVFLQGGESANQYAKIYVNTGGAGDTLTMNLSGVLSLSSLSNGPAEVSSIEDLSVTAGQDIVVLRNGTIQNQQNPLTLIAGKEIVLGTNSTIFNGDGSDVTLVLDNENPSFPKAGNNQLIMSTFATVSNGGGQIRIFTSKNNRIEAGATVNGEPLVETIETTGQNRWGVYYPSSFFGGPGYTLFHKRYPDGTVKVAYGAEMFYRLEDWRERLFVIDNVQRFIDRSIGFSLYYDCATYGGMPEYNHPQRFTIRAFR